MNDMFDKFFDDLIKDMAQSMLDRKIKKDAQGLIGQALLIRLIRTSNSHTLKTILDEVYDEYKSAIAEKREETYQEDNELLDKMESAYDEAYKQIREEVYKLYNHD